MPWRVELDASLDVVADADVWLLHPQPAEAARAGLALPQQWPPRRLIPLLKALDGYGNWANLSALLHHLAAHAPHALPDAHNFRTTLLRPMLERWALRSRVAPAVIAAALATEPLKSSLFLLYEGIRAAGTVGDSAAAVTLFERIKVHTARPDIVAFGSLIDAHGAVRCPPFRTALPVHSLAAQASQRRRVWYSQCSAGP